MSGNDVATYSIRVGVKDDVTVGINRLKPIIEQQMKAIETSSAGAINQIDRQMDALMATVIRLGRAGAQNKLFSERDLSNLEQARIAATGLADQLMRLNSSTAGMQSLERLQAMRQSLSMTSDLAIPSLSARKNLPDYGSHFIDMSRMHGPPSIPAVSVFDRVRDFERMGLATRPVFTREDESIRQGRINERLIRQDPKAYEARWVKLLEGQDNKDRLKSAFERNQGYGYVGRPEQRYLNPSTPDGPLPNNWQAGYRNMDPYGNRGPQGMPKLDASLRWQEMNDQRNKYLQTSRELNQQYQVEESHYTKLTEKYGKFTEEQRKGEKLRLRAREGLGHDVSTSQRALNEVMDPFSVTNQNKGGYLGSHGFRFASQNAAFALEDYMVSSQFGGPKAGFRAITNNLTAIASAMPFANPLVSAGVIGGTAILGASAPLLYDQFMKKDIERSNELKHQETFAEVRKSQEYGMLSTFRQLSSSGLDPSSKIGAMRSSLFALQDSQDVFQSLQNEYDLLIGNPEGNRKRLITIQNEQAIEREKQTKQGSINRMAGSGFERDLETNNLLRNLQQSFVGADVSMLKRKLDHEIIDPAEEFAGIRDKLTKDYKLRRGRETDPINQRMMDDAYSKSMADVDRDAAFASIRHPFALRDRDRAHDRTMLGYEENPMVRLGKEFTSASNETRSRRDLTDSQRQEQLRGIGAEFDRSMARLSNNAESRLNQFETNPVKRINKEFDLTRREIMTDKLLNDQQREQALAGLEKMRKGALDQANDYPGLGSAIEVGSASDVALRQKYFDRSGSSGSVTESEKKLGEIVEAVREVKEAIKANKPKVASRRGR